jgi:ribonuclease BN (tRNA processing enzyme)
MSTSVTLLCTGSPLPTAGQAGPATLIRAGRAVLLAGCGRGVVMRPAGGEARP